MFFVFSLIFTLIFVCLDLIFLKVFQLSGYKIVSYLKNVAKFSFSFGKKTPLKFTKRAKRQIFFDFLAKFVVFFLIFFFFSNFYWKIVFVFLLLIFSPIFVIFSFLIALPIENCIKKRFIKKAKRKIKFSKCKIIAITGSFGKTSTKEFLAQILSEHFSVCSSPKSFNTEMGICKTILENLMDSDDFLILEFGARKRGDIQKLCDIVGGVDFGIVSPLGNCHMQTFKTRVNLENTKFELCENVREFVVFNGKSEGSKRLFERFSGEKFMSATENGYCYAKNIELTRNGSSFDLVLFGKSVHCNCPLLGSTNIDNVCSAALMANLLGLDVEEIQLKIANLKPSEHRLQLISSGVVPVIDDSYNSNFDGFCEALEVLSKFEGRKIVVSPGFVELGNLQFEENKKIAQKVAEVADVFVIMNKTNRAALEAGSRGKCEILFATTRDEQKALLKNLLKIGDVVLFENDFPDNIK